LPYKDVGKVTASIGVSSINEIKHFSTMVEEADKAVYFGKDNGRDQVALYRDTLEKPQNNVD
jgi:PleD family two-component response regulator